MSISLQTDIIDVNKAQPSIIKVAQPFVTQCQIYIKLFYTILNTKALNSLNEGVTKPVARTESITEGF